MTEDPEQGPEIALLDASLRALAVAAVFSVLCSAWWLLGVPGANLRMSLSFGVSLGVTASLATGPAALVEVLCLRARRERAAIASFPLALLVSMLALSPGPYVQSALLQVFTSLPSLRAPFAVDVSSVKLAPLDGHLVFHLAGRAAPFATLALLRVRLDAVWEQATVIGALAFLVLPFEALFGLWQNVLDPWTVSLVVSMAAALPLVAHVVRLAEGVLVRRLTREVPVTP